MARTSTQSPQSEPDNTNRKESTGFSGEFIAALQEEKKKLELPRSSKLTVLQTEKVLNEIMTKYGLNREQTLAGLTILFQQGGTARKCDGNLTIKIFDKELKLSEIRAILRKEGLKNAERKLARALATDIQKISVYLELPGNLAKKVQKNNPDVSLTIEELAWLSDFQSDNEDCPGPLKQYILECFKTKGDNPPKQQKKKSTGK